MTKQAGRLLDVKMDAVGKAANTYVDALDAREAANLKVQTSAEDLRHALSDAGRSHIVCRGVTLSIKTIQAGYKIQVKKSA